MLSRLRQLIRFSALAALLATAVGIAPSDPVAAQAALPAERAQTPAAAEPEASDAPADAPAPEATPSQEPDPGAEAAPAVEHPFPVVYSGEDGLPEAVRETRRKILDAARSGDMENLRAVIGEQREPPSVAFDTVGDPIGYLKALASDAGGREILAILLEVLEAGHVHLDPGGPEEIYLWPYFAAYPLEALTPPQLVELFTLLASAEYEEMRSYGAYTFFRVGIAPDGEWRFFLAGD